MLAEHPYLKRQDILAALRYADWLAQGREIDFG
ncbi:MAG TPA: hypothetical protein VF745_02775 [Steroidobacteraceae bacterium]